MTVRTKLMRGPLEGAQHHGCANPQHQVVGARPPKEVYFTEHDKLSAVMTELIAFGDWLNNIYYSVIKLRLQNCPSAPKFPTSANRRRVDARVSRILVPLF